MKPDWKALPPEEAIKYFRAKGLLTESFAWQDLWHQDHATQFTVAKSAGFDILRDIYDAVQAAIDGGTTYEDFSKRLTPILQEKGWWGRKVVTDPATGEPVNAQLGSPRRLRIIFDVNLRMSYATGHWARITRTAASRPWLRYSAVLDNRTRDDHKRWHGTILRWDHDWWNSHYPPNGWRCRCSVIQLSDSQLKHNGWTPSEVPPQDTAPPTVYENPRTGDHTEVPEGIDPGFSYHPGKAAIDEHAARLAMGKIGALPPAAAAAAMRDSLEFLAPLVRRDWQAAVRQAETALEAAKANKGGKRPDLGARGRVWTLGIMPFEVQDTLTRQYGQVVQSAALTIDDDVLIHMIRDAKQSRGGALDISDVMGLPDHLGAPDEIYWDTEDAALLFVFQPTDPAKRGKAVIRVNSSQRIRLAGKRQQILTNAIRTSGLVQPSNLAPPKYERIWPVGP